MRKLLMAALLIAMPAAAILVDRIAITVGNRVITASEVDLRVRLTAFQNGEKPRFSVRERKEAAEHLIDQRLVEREMEVGHFPRLSEEGRKQLMGDYAEQYFKSDPATLERALAEYGLAPSDLEDDLARQSDLLTFLNLRFRPAVQVSEQDLRKSAAANQISLDQFRAQLEQKLASERADADLEGWVRDQRKRTRIEYLDKELVP